MFWSVMVPPVLLGQRMLGNVGTAGSHVPTTPVTYRVQRCDYCGREDFAHGQCNRCGAPQPRDRR